MPISSEGIIGHNAVQRIASFGRPRPATALLEVPPIAKQSSRSASVNEDDVLAFHEMPLADQVDQAGHALAGINGIKQYAFEAGGQTHGLDQDRKSTRLNSSH